jgi:hypothetical protein
MTGVGSFTDYFSHEYRRRTRVASLPSSDVNWVTRSAIDEACSERKFGCDALADIKFVRSQ